MKLRGYDNSLTPTTIKEVNCHLARKEYIEIKNILDVLRAMRVIHDKQLEFLTPSAPNKPRAFYLLPKVHKPLHKWPHTFMPEGRPIVADSGSETERVAQFIYHFLQPLVWTHPAYIKDTYHFIDRIRGQVIPQDAFLVNGDISCGRRLIIDNPRNIRGIPQCAYTTWTVVAFTGINTPQ